MLWSRDRNATWPSVHDGNSLHPWLSCKSLALLLALVSRLSTADLSEVGGGLAADKSGT